jgi:myo-inositol 2-dehydrogenase / D-chiro-inositol 1-dehydrogenase
LDRINVALIGAGRMGQVHGRNATRHPRLRLRHVVDPRPEAAAVAAELGADVVSLDQVLDDRSIGGVLICSSTDQHLTHALAALDAGKAIFCEKPVDLDLAKARQAQSRFDGARFVLGFNRRFDPHYCALKQRIDAGAIGRIETLHLINHDPAAPPPGFIPTSGGLFRDFTIHDLDLARWILGEEPAQLYTAASCLVDPEIGRLGDVDTARVVLTTASGRIAVICNTRRSGYGYDQRIEAYGAAGMASAGNVARDTVHMLTEAGDIATAIEPGFAQRYVDAYRLQLAHFVDVARGETASRATFADGVCALALADACEHSLHAGRALNLKEFLQ